jgi:hypothetical protein
MATKKRTFDAIDEYRNTSVRYDEGGRVDGVQLYNTVIFQRYPDGMIRLSHGGHKTPTTKRRMNEALMAAGLPYEVIQRDFVWYVRNTNTDERIASWASHSPSVRFMP